METSEELVKFLGEGSYGYVHLVKHTNPDGSSFHAAVKHSYDYDLDNLQRELEILLELRGNQRIIECFGDNLEQGLSSYGNKVHKLRLEYAPEGSLNAFMADRKLPESTIRDFTRMVLQGLVTIHRHGYVHCDIKSDNLLVFPSTRNPDSPYELKISDFGNSLRVGQVPEFWGIDSPFVGTPIYMPPESLRDGIAKKTLDLWSVGCLVLEMYTGVVPWDGVKLGNLKTRLLDGKAPEIPESLPCDARSFIETCFSRKPEDRGSAFELLFHRFLSPRGEEEERINSFLLKLKLRITRASNKKSRDVVAVVSEEKKKKQKQPLKFKFFPSKPPQFKTSLSKFLKIMPMKHSTGSSLVSVQ